MTESENKNATLHTHAEWLNENTDKFNNSDKSRYFFSWTSSTTRTSPGTSSHGQVQQLGQVQVLLPMDKLKNSDKSGNFFPWTGSKTRT